MNRFKQLLLISLLLCSYDTIADAGQTEQTHDSFQRVITLHVRDGIVDYPAINMDNNYQVYIESLKEKIQFKSSAEELSYWINAYNALAIKGILDGRSPESFFGKVGYFYNAEYMVNGLTINLYDLEHDIIIPLNEPRIHFSLNCASKSCPKLSSTTYQQNTLEQQLEHAAATFINDPSLNHFDLLSKTAHLSKIFDWFADDFDKHSGSVQNYLALYITDTEVSNALANNDFQIEYMEYDWSLNGAAPKHNTTEDN